MWKKLDGLISGYLDTVKLTDMMSPADGPALNGGTSPRPRPVTRFPGRV